MKKKYVAAATIDKSLHDFLGQISKKERMSRSTWIRRMISRASEEQL